MNNFLFKCPNLMINILDPSLNSSNPTVFKKDINQGSRLGKNKGIQTGFRWIANLKIGVE